MTTRKRTTRENRTALPRTEEYEARMRKQRRNKRIKGLVLVILALLCLLSYFGIIQGSLGTILADFLRYGFGLGALAVPLFLLVCGFGFAVSLRNYMFTREFWILWAGFCAFWESCSISLSQWTICLRPTCCPRVAAWPEPCCWRPCARDWA